jgi:integrase
MPNTSIPSERFGSCGLSNAIYQAQWVSLGKFFAMQMPQSITKESCKVYAEQRFRAGRSGSTVHTELARLRACLKWAATHGRVLDRPVAIWVPPPGKSRKTVLTIPEVKRLIEATDAPHMWLFVILAFTTGGRHGAILDLTWDRIDWINGTIDLDDKPTRDPMSRAWRKGRATVPMNALSRTALERAYAGRSCEHVIEYDSRRLTTVRQGFAGAVKRAGLAGKITPHTLRHTAATLIKEQGHDSSKIGLLLGHAPGSAVTDEVYIHQNASRVLGDAVKVLDIKIEHRN